MNTFLAVMVFQEMSLKRKSIWPFIELKTKELWIFKGKQMITAESENPYFSNHST
jgi:hypothetical protein